MLLPKGNYFVSKNGVVFSANRFIQKVTSQIMPQERTASRCTNAWLRSWFHSSCAGQQGLCSLACQTIFIYMMAHNMFSFPIIWMSSRAELVERNILLPTEEDAKSMDAPSTAAPQRTHALNASTSSLSEDFSDTDSDSESEPTLSEQEEVAVSLSSMPSSTHSGWNMADRRTPSANKANFLGSVSSYRSVRTLQQSEGPEQQLQQQQGAQTSSSSGRRSGTAARQHKEKRKAVLISQSSAIVGKSTKEEKGLLASWGKDATVDGME